MNGKWICALAFTSGVTGQAYAAALPAGCGAEHVQYKVKVEKGEITLPPAPPDKAQFVFIETTEGPFSSGPISRFGVDGSWVGATKGKSFFTLLVDPGAHQVCASRQSSIKLEQANVGADTVQARAGKTYVFQFAIHRTALGSPEMRVGPQGVPGSSMTAKDADTIDTAELTAPASEAASTMTKGLPQATGAPK